MLCLSCTVHIIKLLCLGSELTVYIVYNYTIYPPLMPCHHCPWWWKLGLGNPYTCPRWIAPSKCLPDVHGRIGHNPFTHHSTLNNDLRKWIPLQITFILGNQQIVSLAYCHKSPQCVIIPNSCKSQNGNQVWMIVPPVCAKSHKVCLCCS